MRYGPDRGTAEDGGHPSEGGTEEPPSEGEERDPSYFTSAAFAGRSLVSEVEVPHAKRPRL